MTGMISASNSLRSTVGSTWAGVPTNPSAGSVGVQTISRASLPVSPTARPPASLIAWTMRLLTRPASTISTTSIVASSVTRLPFTHSLSTPRRLSISLIIGPPPWTTTGFTPTWRISTMSRAKLSISSWSPIALPPNFTTTVAPS